MQSPALFLAVGPGGKNTGDRGDWNGMVWMNIKFRLDLCWVFITTLWFWGFWGSQKLVMKKRKYIESLATITAPPISQGFCRWLLWALKLVTRLMEWMDDGWRFSYTWCCFHREQPGVLGPFRGGILGFRNLILGHGWRNAGGVFFAFWCYIGALWEKRQKNSMEISRGWCCLEDSTVQIFTTDRLPGHPNSPNEEK